MAPALSKMTLTPRVLFDHLWDGLKVRCLIDKITPEDGNPGNLTPAPSSSTLNHPWRRTLDELCHLCQFRKAGSVTSISAEDFKGDVRFWLAMNKKDCSEETEHLEWILREMKKIGTSHDVDAIDLVADNIAKESINRSSQRVRNYHRILCGIILEVEKHFDLMSTDDVDLRHKLYGIRDASASYDKLCKLAYKFRHKSAYRTLLSKCLNSRDPWSRARHLIGRLGSWHKAARFLSMYACEIRNILQSYTVDRVPYTLHTKPPEMVITIQNTIQGLLDTVYPSFKDYNLAQENMTEATNTFNTWKKNDQEPGVHSESATLYHFVSSGRKFVNDDRYVGCSKPSCYACSLYFDQFPDIVKRPTSNQVWIRWYPPGIGTAATMDRRNVDIIRSMADTIQSEVINRITKKAFGNNRRWDSTTGMEASFRAAMNSLAL